MSYGQHETEINLCFVPWDNRYLNVPKFGSEENQYSYFANRGSWFTIDDEFRFVDGANLKATVRVNVRPERCQGYNYCVYSNNDDTGFSHVYCFISNVKAINYAVSELSLEVDIMQTYQFRFAVGDSKIDWETSLNTHDTLKQSLFDNPNYETEIDTSHNLFDTHGYYYYICLSKAIVSYKYEGVTNWSLYSTQNFSATVDSTYYPFGFVICSNYTEVKYVLGILENNEDFDMKNVLGTGLISKCIATQPHTLWCSSISGIATHIRFSDQGQVYTVQSNCIQYAVREKTFNRPTLINNGTYEPLSFALRSYPFYYPRLNCGGKTLNLRWEDSNDIDTITIGFDYYFTDKWHCVAYPKNYKKYGQYSQCIDCLIDIPISTMSPYNLDSYLQYLTENKTSLESQKAQNIGTMVLGGLQLGVGAIATATGGGASAGVPLIISGVGTLATGGASAIKTNYELSNMKKGSVQEINGAYADDIVLLQMDIPCKFENVQIRFEKIKQLDRYLQMYGYPVHRYGTPAVQSGCNWSYVKTDGCTIKPYGNKFMTNDIKERIQCVYDNGVRFWYDAQYTGDFSHYNWKYVGS